MKSRLEVSSVEVHKLQTLSANRFTFAGKDPSGNPIKISYATENSLSGTVLTYQSGANLSIFIKGQISLQSLDIGTLVSVCLGAGGEPVRVANVLTLMIPDVLFPATPTPAPGSPEEVNIESLVIFTDISTPVFRLPGVQQSYQVLTMKRQAFLDRAANG